MKDRDGQWREHTRQRCCSREFGNPRGVERDQCEPKQSPSKRDESAVSTSRVHRDS